MDTVIKTIIIWVGSLFWTYLMTPLVWLLELEFELLKLVSRYNNFSSEAGVTLGWIALRDLSNMFFILVFLVIGFATILRISSYGYQQLLRKTIIIAILINFSKTIVGFVIDVVQVIMLTFIAAVDDIMSGGLVVAIGLHNLFSLDLDAISDQPTMDFVVSLVMGAALVAILLVVIGVMVMMLLMRIVALWVAIILSPLAFFSSIFPATQSFYNQWLKQLGTNLVTGPMLAFFLWLTFAIVGNGEAYRSFMANKVGGGPTEFLGTSNMVNYIVSIAMLLMGIKVAAKSGAAGANIAAKGMDKIQSTASKLARRYPKAAAMRMANWGAGKLIDKDGNARTDTWAGRRFGTFSKAAFWGGKSQRSLMRLQGKNTARIVQEAAEDEKYINPRQRKAYYDTLTRQSAKPGEVGFGIGWAARKVGLGENERLGRILQGSSSWAGGHFDSEVKKAVVMSDRGQINSQEEADFVARNLEKVNDQPRLDKLRKQWANTYDTEEEASRHLNETSLSAMMRDQKAEAALYQEGDKKGQVTDGAKRFLEAALKDKDVSSYDIYKAILSKDKKGRVAWNAALEQVTGQKFDTLDVDEDDLTGKDAEKREKAKERVVLQTNTNEETGIEEVEFNEKSALQMNTDHEMVKATGGLLTYPQQAIAGYNAMISQMEKLFAANKIGFGEHAIDNLKQRAAEKDSDFEARRKKTKTEWDKASEEYKKDGDTQKLYTTRRQLMGMYTNEEVQNQAPAIVQRMEAAKARLQGGQITTEQYATETKDDQEKLENMYASTLLHIDDKDTSDPQAKSQAELAERVASLVGGGVPVAPEKKTAKKEDVTDEEIEERTKKKIAELPESKVLDKDGKPVKPAASVLAEKRAEAKRELEAEKDKKYTREQDKYDKEYGADMVKFNDEWNKLPGQIREALENINKDKDAQDLKEVEVKLQQEQAKAPEDKDAKIIADLLAKQESLIRLQSKKRREAMGLETSNTRNHLNRAILKDATDGFDYSRLQEMPIHEGAVRDLFKELSRVATQDQQKAMLDSSNPNQIELFARTMVPTGQKLNKSIIDNLTPNIRLELFKLMNVIKEMRGGLSEAAAWYKVNNMPEKDLSNIK